MKINDHVTISGTSKKAKQRIQQHGAIWRILEVADKVLFNPAIGPWLHIVPADKAEGDLSSRWVHANSDQDFVVMPNSKKENSVRPRI